MLQVIDEKIKGMGEGLEKVGVQGETLLFHQFIRAVVDVIKEVKSCT